MSKIDKIMEKYVQSTAKGEKDFEKLELQLVENPVKDCKKISKKKVLIPVISVLAILIIVIVPVVVLNNQEASSVPHYSSSNIKFLPINREEIKDETIKRYLPTIETLAESFYNMKSNKDDNIIGVFWEGAVFDDVFNSISIHYINNKYDYLELEYFSRFSNQVKWQNVDVKYEINDNGVVENNIYIESGNYKIYIQADSESNKDIVEILDLIFG